MNMYEQYNKERENLDVIKTDKGFIFYRIDMNETCMINDCFVLKEYRNTKHGTFLTNQVFEICKQAGVKTVYCNTDDRANGVAVSRFSIEQFGFELYDSSGPISNYKLEVSEWEKL
jgi:N-acetylglutamate synthase-like GNAT family acetyltransferase